MRRALRLADATGAWGLILIGCLHNFVGAPALFDTVSEDLFWFLSAGLALWYAGAVNLIRQYAPSRLATYLCGAVNLTLLAFVVASGLNSGEIKGAGGILLVALAGIETVFGLIQAYSSAVSARSQAP
ncbi:MAG: hypothetical protein ACXWUN_11960 [Allosphingosinicella sp.]